MLKCKYFKPHMEYLREIGKALYKKPGWEAGGHLHILLDDDNYDDESVTFCLNECLKDVKNPGSSFGAFICCEYLKMTMMERSVFDWYWNGWPAECPSGNTSMCTTDCPYINAEDFL